MKWICRIYMIFFFIPAFSMPAKKIPYTTKENAANNKGKFDLFITGAQLELLLGLYRNRSQGSARFTPINFTYQIYFPFQYELNYKSRKETEDKLFKINFLTFIHHSNKGNYGIGFAPKFSFLLFRRAYLSYQIGIGWFEVTAPAAKDGLNKKGFNFHHILAFTYHLTPRWQLSLNGMHVSNGGILGRNGNLQDVIALGVGYQFKQKNRLK